MMPMTAAISCVLLAGTPQDVFPQRVTAGDRALVLNGFGLCEYGLLGIDLYWGALYLEDKSREPEHILRSTSAKRIHLHFLRDLSREQLAEAFTAALKVNSGEVFENYRASLDELTGMLTPIKTGQSMIFTHSPQRGLHVEINQQSRGVIRNMAFTQMFFRLYLGEHPPDPQLKAGMLRGES